MTKIESWPNSGSLKGGCSRKGRGMLVLLVNNSKSIDDMLKESSDLIGGCTIRESSVVTVLNKPCVTGMLTSSGEVIHCFLKVNLVAQDLKLVSVEFELWKMLVNTK